jgi:hypothetical protein
MARIRRRGLRLLPEWRPGSHWVVLLLVLIMWTTSVCPDPLHLLTAYDQSAAGR